MKTLGFVVLLFPICWSFAQPPDTLWTRFIGTGATDYGRSVIACPDGGYLVSARYVTDSLDYSCLFMRLTESGDIQWARTVDYFAESYPINVWPDGEGGFAAIVFARNRDGLRGWSLIRLDGLGEFIYCRSYFFTASYQPGILEAAASPGGGWYLVGGYRDESYTCRLDENGDTLWTRLYGGHEYDCGQAIAATMDGGCLTAG